VNESKDVRLSQRWSDSLCQKLTKYFACADRGLVQQRNEVHTIVASSIFYRPDDGAAHAPFCTAILGQASSRAVRHLMLNHCIASCSFAGKWIAEGLMPSGRNIGANKAMTACFLCVSVPQWLPINATPSDEKVASGLRARESLCGTSWKYPLQLVPFAVFLLFMTSCPLALAISLQRSYRSHLPI
jgi:hypothetical protein